MLAKFIIIAFTAEVLLLQNAAMASCVNTPCPNWVKLNKSPVCFGARGNSFGKFTYDRNIFVSSFMLVHRTGTVTCNKHQYSYWGCASDKSLAVILTVLADQQEKILAPVAAKLNSGGWYDMEGYTSSSSVLVFCVAKKPHCIHANSELRLWYGEDLRGYTESDNGGKTCADVYGLLA